VKEDFKIKISQADEQQQTKMMLIRQIVEAGSE
jgi:hypothetical protein